MNKLYICILALFLVAASVKDARKANEAYREGDYATAIELYKKAIEEDPEDPKLYFNLGNALAKDGQAEEAIRCYEQFKSMTDDAGQRALADYNMGNIYAESEDWGQAANHYKQALRQQDTDFDAKHNYELAMRKQQEEQQQQDQNQQQDQQQNQQDQQDQQNQQQNQDQQQQNQQNNQQQDQQDQPENNQQNQQQAPNQVSQAEAEKILKALKQKEKELLKEFKKQKTESSKSTNEKDW